MGASPHTFAGADDSELAFAARELAVGREQLRIAHAICEKRDRVEAIETALAKLELATRAVGVVVQRRRARRKRGAAMQIDKPRRGA